MTQLELSFMSGKKGLESRVSVGTRETYTRDMFNEDWKLVNYVQGHGINVLSITKDTHAKREALETIGIRRLRVGKDRYKSIYELDAERIGSVLKDRYDRALKRISGHGEQVNYWKALGKDCERC